MKTRLTILLLGLASSAVAQVREATPPKASGAIERPALPEPPGLATIGAAELKEWAGFLAADELGGRLTGSPGQKRAAEYIAKHFQSLGLEPLGDPSPKEGANRSYVQKYGLTRNSLAAKTQLTIGQDTFSAGFAVMPGRGGDSNAIDAEMDLVYAGLIGTRRFKKGLELEDWTGKVPVFVIDLPKSTLKMGIEQQMGMGMFLLTSLKRRVTRYSRSGAKAAVFCILDDSSAVSNMLTYVAIAPGQDLMEMPGSSGMGAMMSMMQATVPMVFLARQPSLAVAKHLGMTEADADAVQSPENLEKLKQPKGKIVLEVQVDKNAFATNVVAVLRGSDPLLRDEAVIYSAHMDHVGKRFDGDVFNGADDNASGSAGLMAIAKAFAKGGPPPRRSVIFLSVSGEELGLWGSAYYANHPTWPIDKIVANVNTDMIGRNGPESAAMEVTVTPSFRHKQFSTIVKDAAVLGAQMGMTFHNGDKYYARSDHYNFARKGIPVVFFCNGEHEDYHQVSDHADKLDGDKMERIAKIAYWTGYRVAQTDERPRILGRVKGWLEDPPTPGEHDK